MILAKDLFVTDAGVIDVQGKRDLAIKAPAPLDSAYPGAFLFAKSQVASDLPEGTIDRLDGTALVCLPALAAELSWQTHAALVITENPRLTFMHLASRFFSPTNATAGINATAVVHPSAVIDATASIGAGCFIGEDCHIGAGSILHPHIVLHSRTIIGRNVVVHSGTVIGSDGFGYERRQNGELEKFPHYGGVVIEDDVEIGSNTSIDRGSLANTVLRRGCKIDNQVHVAHNVIVGEDAVVIAQSMIGGSVKIGARAWLAPAAIILNQVDIGKDAVVGLGAVVTKSVADGDTVMGSPAVPSAVFRADRAALRVLLQGAQG